MHIAMNGQDAGPCTDEPNSHRMEVPAPTGDPADEQMWTG
jgi:hypothetical protein